VDGRVVSSEIHGSRSEIPSKKSLRHRCAEGFNSGVKGLNTGCYTVCHCYLYIVTCSVIHIVTDQGSVLEF
jgi:hypothetical protein